jgi:hypothetical protein
MTMDRLLLGAPENASVVIAGLVQAIHLEKAWTTGTSPVVKAEGMG